jgi:predicted RNA-binding protein YlqC (UPF0109 family)
MGISVNYLSLIENMIRPLILQPEDLRVKFFPSEDDAQLIQVFVSRGDLGRVIGKQGRTASAIRTLAISAGAKDGVRLKINFDAY